MEYSALIDAVLYSGPITLSIFISLLVLSVLIWAVIMAKAIQFRKEQKSDQAFLNLFNRTDNFKQVPGSTEFLKEDKKLKALDVTV